MRKKHLLCGGAATLYACHKALVENALMGPALVNHHQSRFNRCKDVFVLELEKSGVLHGAVLLLRVQLLLPGGGIAPRRQHDGFGLAGPFICWKGFVTTFETAVQLIPIARQGIFPLVAAAGVKGIVVGVKMDLGRFYFVAATG